MTPELLKGFLKKVSVDGLQVVAEQIAEPEALLALQVPLQSVRQEESICNLHQRDNRVSNRSNRKCAACGWREILARSRAIRRSPPKSSWIV